MRPQFPGATIATTVIRYRERSLCAANAESFWCNANRLAGQGARVVLDLATVEVVDGAALARLVALYRTARAAGGNLTLDNVGHALYEVLAVTGLARLFRVAEPV